MSSANRDRLIRRPGALYATTCLTCINILNYTDRYLPSATKDLIKKDLSLSDAQTALPLTAFMVVYMLTSPLFGLLADRHYSRKALIITGILLWCFGTVATAFPTTFWQLLLARAVVGIGEASYATIGPAFLAEFYPPQERSKLMTLFYIAIPVGSSLGFALGGSLSESLGWRNMFLIVGAPGLLVALSVIFVQDPGRGMTDYFDITSPALRQLKPLETYRKLWQTREYTITVFGMILVTFATGGIADWLPTFLHRVHSLTVLRAGVILGFVVSIGGIVGVVTGGLLYEAMIRSGSDWLKRRCPHFVIGYLTMIPAAAVSLYALWSSNTVVVIALIFMTALLSNAYLGPLNAGISNSVGTEVRASAFSISILLSHLFGDAISPYIIGFLSDLTHQNIRLSLNVVPLFMLAAASVWMYGSQTVISSLYQQQSTVKSEGTIVDVITYDSDDVTNEDLLHPASQFSIGQSEPNKYTGTYGDL